VLSLGKGYSIGMRKWQFSFSAGFVSLFMKEVQNRKKKRERWEKNEVAKGKSSFFKDRNITG